MEAKQSVNAFKAHRRHIGRLKADKFRSTSKQGHRVDQLISALTKKYANVR